jgi:hypothetical protein
MAIRFEKIWVQQCRATKAIKRRFDAKSALDYHSREAVELHPGSRAAIGVCERTATFLAEVWRIFNEFEIAGYVASLKPKHRKTVATCCTCGELTPGPATSSRGILTEEHWKSYL